MVMLNVTSNEAVLFILSVKDRLWPLFNSKIMKIRLIQSNHDHIYAKSHKNLHFFV